MLGHVPGTQFSPMHGLQQVGSPVFLQALVFYVAFHCVFFWQPLHAEGQGMIEWPFFGTFPKHIFPVWEVSVLSADVSRCLFGKQFA